MKKISLAILIAFPLLLSSTFAQLWGVAYGLKDGKSVQGQHFVQQTQLATPYTEAQCLPNNGLYVNERIYLPGDVNNDGIKDVGKPYYLSDNLRVIGDDRSRYLYLIDPMATQMYYHLPQSNSFTIWSNNVNYPVGSNSVWYRQSKVAPVNQWVRAISSEPVLFQAPIGGSLTDRVVQIAYQISYRGYRSNGGPANNYFTYPVASGSDFSSDVRLWSLNGTYNDNNGQGPLWQADYLQTRGVISTSSITWGDPISHGLECLNYHLSRCGDGYIDASGQEPVKGTQKQSHVISDSGVTETCDPGADLSSYVDDVMPNGAAPTSYYNCTASCKLSSNAILTIDKQQKLSSSSVYEGVGLGTLSTISYSAPAGFDFKIIIKNDGGDATNVVLRDVLPVGFALNACAGTLSDGTSVACEAQAGTSLNSMPFALSAGKSATFIVKGILNAASATTNTAYASYTNPSTNVVANTATDVVNQNPIVRPVLSYTKTVRNVTSNSNNGQFVEADNQASAVVVKTGDVVQYQITVNKTGGPVTAAILNDALPQNGGFLMSGYVINGVQYTSTSFPATDITALLNSSSTVVVTLYGTVGVPSGTQFVNTATLTESSYVLVPTFAPGSNVANTVLDNTPPPTPDVAIKKEVESVSTPNIRQELSTVSSGQTIRFKITYNNISSVNALNAVIADVLPVGLTCVSAIHQDGDIVPCTANGISYKQVAMNPGVSKYIIVTALVTSALPTGVTTNTATIQLPGGPIKSDPAQVQLQSITAFDVTKRIVTGSVISGTIITYEISFKNTGNTPITSYTLTDPLQNSIYVAGSSRLNGNIIVTPAYSSGLLTRGCASTNTALNGQSVCPLQAGTTGILTFDVLVK